MTDTAKLVQEFLARGGEIRRVSTGLRRDSDKPVLTKKRDILADLKARASSKT